MRMNRVIALLILVAAALAWLGWRLRGDHPYLATVLLTVSAVLSLLILGGMTGLIGG